MTTAVYPVALRLDGRLAVVVGGGAVAARRASGLLTAGAVVTVIAPELAVETAALVATGAVTWRQREYAAGDLDGAWFVQTATGIRAVDDRVAADAEAARIWCVRADDHRASSAWTPAVARHDDVTVAITAGGDPRRAMAVRDAVQALLRTAELPTQRHRPAAGATVSEAVRDTAATSTASTRVREPQRDGTVALVGAGPGDPGLLTRRARDLIDSATIIVADRLGARPVLDELAPSATIVDVGKLPGHHPVPQAEINRMLVTFAQAGHRVVRLKGGDPYVLGRGGEELLHCQEAGIQVEVVSGITSAISVPAAAGIPVTHRGVAAGFTVVTGHEGIADAPGGRDHTLVLLMGVTALAQTASALAAGTRGGSCPVAIIESGYSAEQRVTIGTLDDIASLAAERSVKSPAVIVVGDVVRLSPHAVGETLVEAAAAASGQ
ncbi:MAG TPA: uroporphyrinogen-III C-methyltransferase [Pseudolysinimonas sp.]|nr:uroporphyrinogen-III C-methyltransferase [Pseudolysinimonas sp.]